MKAYNIIACKDTKFDRFSFIISFIYSDIIHRYNTYNTLIYRYIQHTKQTTGGQQITEYICFAVHHNKGGSCVISPFSTHSSFRVLVAIPPVFYIVPLFAARCRHWMAPPIGSKSHFEARPNDVTSYAAP